MLVGGVNTMEKQDLYDFMCSGKKENTVHVRSSNKLKMIISDLLDAKVEGRWGLHDAFKSEGEIIDIAVKLLYLKVIEKDENLINKLFEHYNLRI